MKKRLLIYLILIALLMTSCQGENSETTEPEVMEEATEETVESAEETEKIRIAGLKGPTTIGLVKLLEDEETYDFQMATTGDELVPKLINGEVDMAAIPVNLASILYQKTEGEVKVAAVNTLGLLYIVTTDDDITSLEDLKGRTIMATGKGTVPEWTLKALLNEKGLDSEEVTVDWKTEPTEIAGILAKEGGTAMVPEPFATVARTKVENLLTPIDLTQEWKAAFGRSPVIGVLVVRKEFAEERPDDLNAFLDDYKESIAFVKEDIDAAATLIESYDIVKAPIAKQAIDNLNLQYIDGPEMKEIIADFLKVLSEEDMKAVGGELPSEGFYYER